MFTVLQRRLGGLWIMRLIKRDTLRFYRTLIMLVRQRVRQSVAIVTIPPLMRRICAPIALRTLVLSILIGSRITD